MKARTTSFSITDTVGAAHAPAPLFANLLEPPRIADDVAGAMFLVIAAAPVALFLLLAVISPFPPACTDVAASTAVTSSPAGAAAEHPKGWNFAASSSHAASTAPAGPRRL
jgi:hypothetical protein